MQLDTVRPTPFDDGLFGTQLHRWVQNTNAQLWSDASGPQDSFMRTARADMRYIANMTQTVADHTIHAVVGTGIGPDTWQTKRGVFGPYKDGMVEGGHIFCTHALRAAATFYGIIGSAVVGLPKYCMGSTRPQTTEHWVYWAKGITDGWAAQAAAGSALWLTRGEEVCKAVGALCQAVVTAVLVGLAAVPVALHGATVLASRGRHAV